MPFIGAGGRAAGRPRGALGALLAAVAVATGVATAGVAAPASAVAGTPYVYVANSGSNTVTAYDAAAGTAVGVTAGILLPSKLTAASCTPGCTWDGSTATWTLPALASGALARFAVTVRAGAPGRVTVLAEATDPTPDPDPYNNVATARITITRHQH